MHIEPGIVDGAKIALSYVTGGAALGVAGKLCFDAIKSTGLAALALRALAATALVFSFFEILPHYSVGVSEVHLIFATTLFLVFGLAPAALGLAAGLAVQGLLFAPTDLPQYFINVTTLLVPLYAMAALARRVIPQQTAYADLSYAQVAALSAAFQGGIVAWVAFWAFYGQGFGAANLSAVGTFGAAYLLVILVEPVLDLAVLAAAKTLRAMSHTSAYRMLFNARLLGTAA